MPLGGRVCGTAKGWDEAVQKKPQAFTIHSSSELTLLTFSHLYNNIILKTMFFALPLSLDSNFSSALNFIYWYELKFSFFPKEWEPHTHLHMLLPVWLARGSRHGTKVRITSSRDKFKDDQRYYIWFQMLLPLLSYNLKNTLNMLGQWKFLLLYCPIILLCF